MQHRRLQVVHMHAVFGDVVAEVIRLTVDQSRLNATARHPDAEAAQHSPDKNFRPFSLCPAEGYRVGPSPCDKVALFREAWRKLPPHPPAGPGCKRRKSLQEKQWIKCLKVIGLMACGVNYCPVLARNIAFLQKVPILVYNLP